MTVPTLVFHSPKSLAYTPVKTSRTKAAPVAAAKSSFRVTGIEPAKGGATIQLSFANEWGSAEKNKQNAEISCYVYDSYGTEQELNGKQWTQKPPYLKPGAKLVGQYTWLGTGSATVHLDYTKLGLEAGKTVFVQACWSASSHVWGSCSGRETGAWTLPAVKNSRLRARGRLASWLHPWPAPRQAPHPTLRCFARRPLRR